MVKINVIHKNQRILYHRDSKLLLVGGTNPRFYEVDEIVPPFLENFYICEDFFEKVHFFMKLVKIFHFFVEESQLFYEVGEIFPPSHT